MIDDDDTRSNILVIASRAYGYDEIIDTCVDDGRTYARLLHGLLALYDHVIGLTHTHFGRVALGAALAERAHRNTWNGRAAALILAFNTALDATDNDLFPFGAPAFNDIINEAYDHKREGELLLGVADVWRNLLPELHTPEGLQFLQEVTL